MRRGVARGDAAGQGSKDGTMTQALDCSSATYLLADITLARDTGDTARVQTAEAALARHRENCDLCQKHTPG